MPGAIDYKKQQFEKVLRGYDMVLGTLRDEEREKAIDTLKPDGKIVSLVGPLDVDFARARGLNFGLKFVFSLMSRKIKRLAAKRGASYYCCSCVQMVHNYPKSALC